MEISRTNQDSSTDANVKKVHVVALLNQSVNGHGAVNASRNQCCYLHLLLFFNALTRFSQLTISVDSGIHSLTTVIDGSIM